MSWIIELFRIVFYILNDASGLFSFNCIVFPKMLIKKQNLVLWLLGTIFSRELLFFHSIHHDRNNKMFFCLSLICSLSASAMYITMLFIFTKGDSYNMVIGLKMQICQLIISVPLKIQFPYTDITFFHISPKKNTNRYSEKNYCIYLGFSTCLIIIFKRDTVEIGMLNMFTCLMFRSDKFPIYYVWKCMCIHARTNTSIFQKHYNCIYLPHFSIPYVRKAPKIYPQKEV